MGGGVVSAELYPSSSGRPDEPEAAGEAEELSLSDGFDLSRSPTASRFIPTRTDAASSNWTCWCFDISNFEVNAHSGVCSQLYLSQQSDHQCGQFLALFKGANP